MTKRKRETLESPFSRIRWKSFNCSTSARWWRCFFFYFSRIVRFSLSLLDANCRFRELRVEFHVKSYTLFFKLLFPLYMCVADSILIWISMLLRALAKHKSKIHILVIIASFMHSFLLLQSLFFSSLFLRLFIIIIICYFYTLELLVCLQLFLSKKRQKSAAHIHTHIQPPNDNVDGWWS